MSYIKEYQDSLRSHIRYVQDAGMKLNVPSYQLETHDASKWMDEEFWAYAKHFHGGGNPVGFASAWLHHIHFNEHHWQHWIFPDGFSPKGSQVENGVVRMPDRFAREMVADWMGASMAYTQSWDMKKWLEVNMPRIRLHSDTATFVRELLDSIGYADVVYNCKFAHEVREGP